MAFDHRVLTAPIISVLYRIETAGENSGISLFETFLMDADSTDVSSVFGNLFIESLGLAVSGGGGIAAYWMNGNVIIGAGSDNHISGTLLHVEPITVHLLTAEDAVIYGSDHATPDYDLVREIFGTSVLVHSCGINDWPAT